MSNSPSLPNIIYGTAWKGEHTDHWVKQALVAGFTAFDTANQPKHYNESLVGKALLAAQQRLGINREQLFLQTKFTPPDGQDHRIPYDPTRPVGEQVLTSFSRSLEHLQTDYVDAYLLHAPYSHHSLEAADWAVWGTLESLYTAGRCKLIGISNVNLPQLSLLTQQAKIKPMIVQNRCFARDGWDSAVREFCVNNNIIYQGFSLLTANPTVVNSDEVATIATRLNKTPAQIILGFAMQIGIIPLTGTTNELHMQQDLQVTTKELSAADINLLKAKR